ncbi:MAG: HAMP domain-containing protein [Spirochaetales bacterium]|nr:HAMP domain-containing protein [Spirochaetales bacterium]
MKFGHKIGLAFIVLTLLTAATGSIGLLFVHRVLSILGGGTADEGPLVRNLEDLSRYMRKAVTISRDVSPDLDVADLVQLRREFNRVAHEFDRAFNEIRAGIEDELSLGRIEEMSTEQRRLKEQTQSLLGAVMEELQVEGQLGARLSAAHAAWRDLVELLGSQRASDGAFSSGLMAGGMPDGTTAPSEPDGGISRFQRLHILPQVQHLLMLLRLELDEHFVLEDSAALEQSDLRVRTLFAQATAAVGALSAFSTEPEASQRTAQIDTAFAGWRDALTGPDGALGLYRRKVELARRTDELSASIQTEAREALAVLDSLVSIRNRLAASEGARGFITAAPSLLIVTVVAATLVSALLAFMLTKNITRPVSRLIAAAEAVGAGDYTRRLQIGSEDELAQLGDAFNDMIAEVGRSQEEVRALNAGLERRVGERTRELEGEVRERRRAELSLRASEERYRTLIESFPSGVIALIDRSFTLIAVGGEAIRRADADPKDFVGRRVDALCPPGLSLELTPRLQSAFEGAQQEFECSAAGAEWDVTIVCNSAAPDTRPETVTVLALDVTEARRAAEAMRQKHQQLIQADKLASLGILAAGMGHEINNPNQAIMMGGQLAARAWPDMRRVMDRYYEREGDFLVGGASYSALRESLGEQLQGIVSSAKRIETIVSSLKGFARKDHTDMSQPVNLNVVVKTALVLLTNVVKKATDNLSVRLSLRPPVFYGNAQQVEQVVLNLIHNACQALQDRRQSIFVATYSDEPGEGVVLEVRDEGAGIPEELLQRVMDPFFTTKRDSGGTGLGLSVSGTIVKEHGGHIQFLSGPGKGTTVRVWFPAKARTGRGVS